MPHGHFYVYAVQHFVLFDQFMCTSKKIEDKPCNKDGYYYKAKHVYSSCRYRIEHYICVPIDRNDTSSNLGIDVALIPGAKIIRKFIIVYTFRILDIISESLVYCRLSIVDRNVIFV